VSLAARPPISGVPVIDIGPFLDGSPDGRALVVDHVRQACEEIGFLTIVGHRVPTELIDEMRRVSYAFFELPVEEKLKIQRTQVVGSHGYSALNEGTLARTLGVEAPPDYQEALSVGPEVSPDDPYYNSEAAQPFFMPNVWPARPADLRGLYLRYYDAVEQLSTHIMRIFALALDLPEHFFADKLDRPVNHLRVVWYPAQATPPLDGQLRSGAHSDYGTLTILLTEDKPGGLQVRRRDGEWVDVHPLRSSFVINIGDMMMRWTNDHWISNVHRVVNPPPESAHVPRLSVVFFQKPNHDAIIACVEKYAGVASAPKYPPVKASDVWVSKNSKISK
jgi:isopenicillin N synthase-like dioxygenase